MTKVLWVTRCCNETRISFSTSIIKLLKINSLPALPSTLPIPLTYVSIWSIITDMVIISMPKLFSSNSFYIKCQKQILLIDCFSPFLPPLPLPCPPLVLLPLLLQWFLGDSRDLNDVHSGGMHLLLFICISSLFSSLEFICWREDRVLRGFSVLWLFWLHLYILFFHVCLFFFSLHTVHHGKWYTSYYIMSVGSNTMLLLGRR